MTAPTTVGDLPVRQRRIIRAWCMYDWAHSSFSTSGVAAIHADLLRLSCLKMLWARPLMFAWTRPSPAAPCGASALPCPPRSWLFPAQSSASSRTVRRSRRRSSASTPPPGRCSPPLPSSPRTPGSRGRGSWERSFWRTWAPPAASSSTTPCFRTSRPAACWTTLAAAASRSVTLAAACCCSSTSR